jgi:CDP-4-dehydro-6-deoxyglucose reductase
VSETYTITLLPMGEAMPCAPGETVLGAMLRSGVRVYYGCTGGGCGVCKMCLISGHLDYGRYSVAVLPEAERGEGFFLSCQAKPVSDLTIHLTEANRYRKVASPFLSPPMPR